MFKFIETDNLKDKEIKLSVFEKSEAVPEKGYFPRYKFNICLLDDTEIGWIDLRVGHNENTFNGGNIGYEVYEAYRGHHYAAKAVRLIFRLAKSHGLDYVTITCESSNIASDKTIRAVGGQFIRRVTIPLDHEMYKRGYREVNVYKIDL